MSRPQPLRNLLRRIHKDERGAVTLETILIIGAIAIPILIFLLRVGWPKIRALFDDNIQDLEIEGDNISNDQTL